MEQSCLICAEDFNGYKRAPITCEYCSFTACSACCQHYILDQESSLCMNRDCQKEWTRKFVVNTFPNAWVSKKWKDMNAKVGVDKEKALFPATMGAVEELKAKEALKDEIAELKEQQLAIMRRKSGTLKSNSETEAMLSLKKAFLMDANVPTKTAAAS